MPVNGRLAPVQVAGRTPFPDTPTERLRADRITWMKAMPVEQLSDTAAVLKIDDRRLGPLVVTLYEEGPAIRVLAAAAPASARGD